MNNILISIEKFKHFQNLFKILIADDNELNKNWLDLNNEVNFDLIFLYSAIARIAELPFWDDYKEDLKSTVADLKNLGGPEAGAITAGKFLEHFTDYPYTHLDIAGPAFLLAPYTYHGKGGTGVGVRLLFDFLKTKSE